MPNIRNKAFRLFQADRLKRKRASYANVQHNFETPCPCSCFICENPRKYKRSGRGGGSI